MSPGRFVSGSVEAFPFCETYLHYIHYVTFLIKIFVFLHMAGRLSNLDNIHLLLCFNAHVNACDKHVHVLLLPTLYTLTSAHKGGKCV